MKPPENEIIISEKDLLALVRGGARVRQVPDEELPPPPGPTDAEQIVSAIRELANAIASRSAPDVKVAAPTVTVKPPIITVAAANPVRKWSFRVTERDAEQRIKTFSAEAVE